MSRLREGRIKDNGQERRPMRREREKFTVARVEREMERKSREIHCVRARSCGVGARWR